MTQPAKTCESCRFYKGGFSGQCRRRAPIHATATGNADTHKFPVVSVWEWCGDYEPKEPTNDPS